MVVGRNRGEPLVRATVYVEGGGNTRALRQACREGFSSFFRKAGLNERMPKVVACGSRTQAYNKFRAAISQRSPDFIVLLVDSEGPVKADTPWVHLREREGDGWERPAAASDRNAHLMVQVMESWFLADRECLMRYFGNGFNGSALPAPQRPIEDVAKADVERALRDSAKPSRKGRYTKGRDSFALLRLLDAAKVIEASPHARRLIDAIAEIP